MEKEMTKDWFVGFIEGEGNFHIALSNTKNKPHYTLDFYPLLQFRIFLREDDLEVLEKIREFLGMGKIYRKNLEYNRRQGIKAKDQYAYYITNSKDLLKLKEILASCNFHTKKERDMEIFFKVLEMKLNKKHLTLEGLNELIVLVGSMNSGMRDNFKIKEKSLSNLTTLRDR